LISAADAASTVLSRFGVRPEVGLILGSGLGAVADQIEPMATVSYSEIPGFPGSTVSGHKGELLLGTLDGAAVAALKGRTHLYEGHSPAEVGFPVRFLHHLGVRLLILTNAAGGLKPGMKAGTLMILDDHINLPGLAGLNPLTGVGEGPERFVDMSAAYDPELRELALSAARSCGAQVDRGVYVMVAGPSYETPAEARLLRQMGADAVGMSTVPEVVVARSLGMRVLAVSCITNTLLDPAETGKIGHSAVLSVAENAASDLARIVRGVLRARE
jgi:purine-nucleoside phosphorylase